MPGDDAVVNLLAELDRRDVRLRVEGDRLRLAAPTGVLTEALIHEIRTHKARILAHLSRRQGIPRADRRDPIPLSFSQEQVWLAQHLWPTTSAYHIPLVARMAGELRAHDLRYALNQLIRRHETLRSSYAVRHGRPCQRIENYRFDPLPLVDLSVLPAAVRDATIAALARQFACRPFDLDAGVVMRCSLVRYGPADHRLMLTRHHIASDGWSFAVLGSELSAHYAAAREGQPSRVPPLARHYADFATWQRDTAQDAAIQRQVDVWRKRLAGADWSLNLVAPASLARIADEPGQAVPARRVTHRLPAEAVERISLAARDVGTTMFTILLSAFGLAVASASGQSDLVIAVPTSGRTRVELEPLIGCFASLLPLRLVFTERMTLRQAARRGHEVVTEALTNQDVPPERVLELAGPARRHLTRGPFAVSFTFQNTPRAWAHLPGVSVELAEPTPVAARFPLAVTLSADAAGACDVVADYDSAALDPDSVADVLARFVSIVTRGCEDLDQPRPGLATRSDPVVTRYAEPTSRESLPRVFTAVAERTPDAIAISQAGAHVSYRALHRRASGLAAVLRSHGVRTETPVGLAVEHRPDLVVAAVGVALSGGTYVPIDLEDPPARREAVLTDAGVEIIVTQATHTDDFAWFDGTVICVDRLPPLPDAPATLSFPPPGAAAYVIYTSGSTGAPKGVMVSHANVVSVLTSASSVVAATPRDVWSLTHASAFDFSVWEMWGPLLTGGRIAVVPRFGARDPGELWRILTRERVTVVSATPSAFQVLASHERGRDAAGRRTTAVRLVVLGGERCEPRKLRSWMTARTDGPALVNMYGITETTVHATWRPLTVDDTTTLASPIGSPLPGVRLYAVDHDGTPTAVRGHGELLVGGAGVARGYLGRPGLTADRFRPDHLGSTPGARLYRSGDIGSPAPGGGFDYLGRLDQQVKIRGYRIEPGEIEVMLAGHPGVSAVAVRERADGTRTTLVAYVAPGRRDQHAPPGGRELRRYLLERLPAYLVPASYVFLEALPLTRNGKLDEAALASTSPDTAPVADADLPRTPTEKALAQLWCELLDAGAVGIHDDFFDLGGDSLLVTRMHGRIPSLFGVQLPMRRIYQALDIASLAVALDDLQRERGDE